MPDSPGARWRGWLRALPVLQGVLPVERSRVPADALAGLTLAALGIPEVLGYAKIAGMPVVTGLYTMLLPMAVFAVLRSSRHLVVAADSATAVILATALSWLPSMKGACQEGGPGGFECAPALVGVNVVRAAGRSTLTPRARRRGVAPAGP
jgi:MFS superfamily sulfate permease-like transporter